MPCAPSFFTSFTCEVEMSQNKILAVLAVSCLSLVPRAHAGGPELAPFAGYAFGGSFEEFEGGRSVSLESGLSYGAALDIPFSEHWRASLLFSRQQSAVGEGNLPAFDLHIERYMAGIQEEHGEGPTRYFGTAYFGVTRFDPGLSEFDSQYEPTFGLSLGLKQYFSSHVGFRAEARGYYAITSTNGGVFCAGSCLFVFGSKGLWQGEVAGGLFVG